MFVMRNATVEDAMKIAPLLREVDKRELNALSAEDLKVTLVASVEASLVGEGFCTVCTVDDEYVAIFGVASANYTDDFGNTIGCPWMLATDKLYEPLCVEHLHKVALEIVEEMNKHFLFLVNVIDERNTVSIKWLKSLGFIFQQRIPYFGYEHIPFWVFYRDRREIKEDA